VSVVRGFRSTQQAQGKYVLTVTQGKGCVGYPDGVIVVRKRDGGEWVT